MTSTPPRAVAAGWSTRVPASPSLASDGSVSEACKPNDSSPIAAWNSAKNDIRPPPRATLATAVALNT
jgi:hypothetical protein